MIAVPIVASTTNEALKDMRNASKYADIVELRLDYIRAVKANENNVSFIVEGYYEVIKEFLVALLLSNGLRSKNHQCMISYFLKTIHNMRLKRM